LTDLSFFKVQIKTEESNREFESLRSQIADIKLFIQEADVTDPFALNEAIARAGVLQQRMNDLRDSTYVNRSIKETFDDVKKGAKTAISEGRRREEESRINTGTVSDGRQRQIIALVTLEVRKQEDAVLRLIEAYDGTSDSVDRVRLAVNGLGAAQNKLDATREAAKEAGASLNNLSNNAYQAGQAIEDFAVGYSLNGIAGGVRGAANNVAFLLNNLAQSDAFTSSLALKLAGLKKNVPAEDVAKLAANLKDSIPLVAGIGSAIAITVLPPLIKWLESLDDIEAKFKDISDFISQEFEDRKIKVGLTIANDEFKRSLQSSESVLEVLKQIEQLDFDAQAKNKQVQEIFKGLSNLQLFDDENSPLKQFEDEFNKIEEVSKKSLSKITKNAEGLTADETNLQGNFSALIGRDSLNTEILKIKSFKEEVFSVRRAILNAVDQGVAGIATPDTFVRVQRDISNFKKTLGENILRTDITDADRKTFESFSSVLDTFSGAFKDAERDVTESTNIIEEKITIAFDAAARKVTELQDQLDLSRAVALDINVDFDLDLLALDAQINEGRRILTESISAIRESAEKRGVPVNEAGIKTLEEEFKVRSLLSVEQLQSTNLKEREKLEERILELKEKQRQSAKFTTLEEFAKNLQINALSGNDEEKRRKKRLEDAQREREQNLEDFRRIQEARGAINDGQGFGDAATRPRVPQGSAGTGFQPFFGDIMKQFTESALNFQQPDNQQLKPEDIKQAVSDGVREGMKVLSEGFGGKAVDAIRNLKGVATAQ
jgi:hypothetical protein